MPPRQTFREGSKARSACAPRFFGVKSIIYSNSTANSILATDKRRLEGDLRGMQQELDNFMSQIKNSEEKTKKAMADAGRLADELRCDYFYDRIYKEAFVKKILNNSVKNCRQLLQDL